MIQMIHIHSASLFVLLQTASTITILFPEIRAISEKKINQFILNLCLEVTTRISVLHNVSKEGSLFYFSSLFFYPALHCVVSAQHSRAKLLYDCPEAHFLLSSDRCKHSFWNGWLISLQICQLCPGLNRGATSAGRAQGLFSQLQLRPEADDLLRWGVNQPNAKLMISLHQSPMKICVVPSEMATQQLFLTAADAFTGVQLRYEHF